jgi:alpha-mannosidase
MANEDVWAIYARREQEARLLLDAAFEALTSTRSGVSNHTNPTTVVFDPLRQRRSQVVAVQPERINGTIVAQPTGDGLAYVFASTTDVGVGQLQNIPPSYQAPNAIRSGQATILSNSRLRLTISGGRITSLYDIREDRELVLAGPGAETGGYMLYEDFPLAYDAWDAEIYHLDCATAITFDTVTVEATGPLRAVIQATASFGKSKIVTRVRSSRLAAS